MSCSFFAVIRLEIPGLHSWSKIPKNHPSWYLKNAHRHVFHIEVLIEQFRYDRDVEYMQAKSLIEDWIRDTYKKDVLDNNLYDFQARSCEMIAREIGQFVSETFEASEGDPKRSWTVRVMEDGENGAEVRGG